MRYFILIFIVCVAAAIGIAGKRGSFSRKTPLYVFPDMRRQLKLRPQTPNDFFPNGTSSQLAPDGTVARSQPVQVGNQLVYAYEDSPVFTGFITGTTNYVENNPFPLTAQLLERGRQRFTIYCTPCHGQLGDGEGITKKLGVMSTVKNLHEKRIVEFRDGEIFSVITYGRSTMGAYGPNVPAEDRWAIVAYVRALQLARLGNTNDIPPELRAGLKK
jgi:hypothetical protein